ncbi:MAG: hypothetical protein K0Q74_1655, partial [Gammaproteobacteria bacterium]|nr:hypothetical protein [Gammaproteobacteria bacterium]
MNFIIGVDDFGKVVREQLDFIDKSLFIKEILDNKGTEASVILRPRRFGKTLNMSMLHHFLAPEVNGLKTKGMFDHLKIAQADHSYIDLQGQYPVIFVTFKGTSYNTYEEAKQSFGELMSGLYNEHYALLSGDTLRPHERLVFERILNQDASNTDLIASLRNLSHYLYRDRGIKPWLLIDEYDTPIQSGYLHHYYEDIVPFMRGVLGSALKGNPNINRAVITGILRVSKESLFSGVNNLKVYSLLNAGYATCFGFTQIEVDEVFKKANLGNLVQNAKAWYNGYHIGDHQIYNPWSIANCLNAKGETSPYWVGTSSNDLIKKIMALASAEIKETFELLLADKSIEAMITENMTFSDLTTNGNALWNLLFFSGYLTIIEKAPLNTDFTCLLRTPNHEVNALYKSIISNWFVSPFGLEVYRDFLKNLTEGNLEKFLSILRRFLKESTSYFDVKGHHPEKFYHGFVLGLIVGLSETHIVESNKESGDGRYDISIIPKDLTKLGLIIEFKIAQEGVALEESALQALAQINTRGYEIALRQKGVQRIQKIGLAFRDKEVEMAKDLS